MSRTISQSAGPSSAHESGRQAAEEAVGDGSPGGEREFYQAYPWCLNPYPTVRETIEYLGGELHRLGTVRASWQTAEVMTNVYLLSCAVLNSIDEYLRGTTLTLPRRMPAGPF